MKQWTPVSNLQAENPNWEPIRKRFENNLALIDDYMWMYEAYDNTINQTVNFYKHRDTRQYLNLLSDGQELEAWKIVNGVS